MRDRDSFYRKARRTGIEDHWNIATFLRNQVEMAIKTHKSELIKQELNKNKSAPRKFWRNLREVIPNQQSQTLNTLYDADLGRQIEREELPDYINRFVSEVGAKLAVPLLPLIGPVGYPPDAQNLPTYHLFEDDINEVISEVDTSKSSAIDNINSMVLKDALTALVPYITKIYNASLRNATFPKAWKFGTVVPIPKQDNITEVTNLRPISLLPMPGKLLEKMVCNRLKQYLETNHILSECQFGFRKGMSTSNAISSLLDEIYNNLNNCKTTFAVFLDLKKAFDTVSHNVLYYKLSQIGLSDHSITWFTSYLNNRWQRVNLNGSMSEYESNPYGVPQGSILGPVLFTIYINSLVQVFNHCKVSMYADDTVITCTDLASLQDEL